MSFARLHAVVTYLIAGLGLYALTLGGELGLGPTALIAAGYGLSVLAREPLLSRPGWIRGWTFAVVGFFALQVTRGLAGGPLLALGIEFAAFLQVSRLFNRRTARDHQQIAVLALLHLIAATVLSASLSYAVVFLGFVIVTPWMLALSHLRREIEGYYPGGHAGPAHRAVADVRRVLASRRVVGARFLAATALLTVPIFAITIALFLVFPRVGMGFLSFGRGAGQPTTGFGRNVELGGFGTIRDDPTVVLRVTPPDLPDDPPAYRSIRMRGTSFDRYDGRRWTRTPLGSTGLRRHGDYYPVVRWADPERDRRWRVVLDHLDEPVIFLPHGTVGLDVPPRVRAGLEVGRQIHASAGHDFRYLDHDDLGLAYTAWVSPDPRESGVDELGEADLALYLRLPFGSERVATLARRITRGARSDAERAQRIERYLAASGTFAYTLEQPDTRGRDPLEVFLFDARRGHCEYFSTAMAVMLRAVDVPSRNVTGFLGGRYNEFGGYYAIRQGDAHSWVEAHVDGVWVTYDPTPPGRDALHPSDDLLADLRALLDALRTRWSRDVVGYDLRVQAGALREVLEWLSSWRGSPDAGGEASTAAAQRRAEGGGGRWPWIALAAGIVLVLLLVLRRRRAHPPADDPALAQASRLYRELDRALARRGQARPAQVTPREHAARLAAAGFPQAAAVERITARYEAARWGGRALEAAEVAALRALIARVRTEKAVRSDR